MRLVNSPHNLEAQSLSDAVISYLYRNGQVESSHLSSCVLLDPTGDIAFSAGPIQSPTYIRSAAKPFQATVLHLSGVFKQYPLSSEDLAIVCASHSGEPIHIQTVRTLMGKFDVHEEQLQCGSHPLYHHASEVAIHQGGDGLTSIHSNCSGKHTGFLAAAKALNADLDSYLEPDHPVQQLILEQIEELSGQSNIALGIDGCSAPTYYLPLQALASMGRTLMGGENPLLKPQRNAMLSNPYLVAGTDRFDTDFMSAMDGSAIAKEGAEGVQLLAVRDDRGGNWALAIKVLDGNNRPRPQVALEILKAFDLISADQLAALGKYYRPVYDNWGGKQYGELITDFKLRG